MIAAPTQRMVSAARGVPPHLAGLEPEGHWTDIAFIPNSRFWWKEKMKREAERLRDLFRPSLPHGQIVRIERIGGAGGARVQTALARSGGEAVLVFWELRANCGTALSTRREPRLTEPQRVFTVAWLRRENGWAGGRPTFDVSAGEFPYRDQVLWPDHTGRRVRGIRVTEYWSLYQKLPERAALLRDTGAALAPLRGWVRAHPALARHPVIIGEVDQAERWAAQAGRVASEPARLLKRQCPG